MPTLRQSCAGVLLKLELAWIDRNDVQPERKLTKELVCSVLSRKKVLPYCYLVTYIQRSNDGARQIVAQELVRGDDFPVVRDNDLLLRGRVQDLEDLVHEVGGHGTEGRGVGVVC
jgi:hypothetical protein